MVRYAHTFFEKAVFDPTHPTLTAFCQLLEKNAFVVTLAKGGYENRQNLWKRYFCWYTLKHPF
jgi:hypothetical protein